MAQDVTGDALRGFGLPYALTPASIWTDRATFTQQGPTPGQPQAQGAYTLALQAAGAQSADKDLRIKVKGRAGVVGPGGAEVIYQYDGDGADRWRGCDVQQSSAWQAIQSTVATSTGALSDPDSCAFYAQDRTDRIAVVYQRQVTTGSPTYNIECAVYDPAGGTWTISTVHSQSDSPTDGYHPAIAYNPRDGGLYVARWTYDSTALYAHIATHRSLDGGVTWAQVAARASDVGVNISAGTSGYEVSRLRMAFSGGQCLLVGHIIDNDTAQGVRDRLVQYFSVSRGGNFTRREVAVALVEGGLEISFSNHSVIELGGQLGVFWPGEIDDALYSGVQFLMRVFLPSASASISARAAVILNATDFLIFEAPGTAGSGKVLEFSYPQNVIVSGDGSVWRAGDGTLYGAFRLATTDATDEGSVFLIQSTDGGLSWLYSGDGDAQGTHAGDASIAYTGDASSYLTSFVGVSHRGRQVLLHLTESDVTTSTTLAALFIGGGSTVTLPGRADLPRSYQRSGWTRSYLPAELPANIAGLITTGAGTDAITTAGTLSRTVSGNTRYSDYAPVSTVAQGLIVRYGLTVNSGGALGTDRCVLKIRTADGSTEYEASIQFTASAFRMYDNGGGGNIGIDKTAVAPSGGIDVLAAVVGGKFSCWFRALDSRSDRSWTTAIQDYTLIGATSPAGTNRIRFGAAGTDTGVHIVHELHYMGGAGTAGALGGGFSNPADLAGQPLSRRGQYIGVDDGVQIVAVDGTAMEGDTFSIATAYDHPIERVLYRESPSPRSTWRSVAVTSGSCAEQLIPFVLNTDATTPGAEEQGFGGTLLYATFAGVNWSSGSIERWDTTSSAWVSVATLDNGLTTAFSLTRRGNELIVPSIPSPSTGRYFRENECAGWTVRFASGVCRRITGNTAGTLAPAVSSPKPVFRLDGIDGSEPTVSTVTLIPDKFAVTFHTNGETGGGWAVRIDAQTTADLDVRCGHLSMGRVYVFGTQYGHGRVSMQESGDLIETTIGGVQRARRAGPGGRTVRIAWPDPIDTTQLQGATTAPDYLTSSTTAGNWPVAAQKDPPLSLRGVLQEVGALDAITYLPCIDIGGSDTIHHRFSDEFMLCTMASAVQVESVLGEECNPQRGEMFRVATVVLEEVR